MSQLNTPLSYDELNSHLNNTTNKLQSLFIDVIKRTQNPQACMFAGPDMMLLLQQRCNDFRYSDNNKQPMGIIFIIGCSLRIKLDFTISSTSLVMDDGTILVQ